MSVVPFARFDDPRQRFWDSLSEKERARLRRDGRMEEFPDGVVVCNQGERGDRVFIVLDGRVEIRFRDGDLVRVLGVRGVGDLVGERASFEAKPRSASVIALGVVKALVVPTDRFSSFLAESSRARDLFDENLYGRLTEPPPMEPFIYKGENSTVLMIDISAFNGAHRNDLDRMLVREVMYDVTKAAFRGSRVPWTVCHSEDRGDGALVIVPPTVATRRVLQPMVEDLAEAVRRHNLRAAPGEQFQLRVALHVGPVTGDPHGMVGEAINMTARILDARAFKKRLAETGSVLGVIVSEYVHNGIVRHLDDAGTWDRIRFQVKESRLTGWVRFL
jgi:CRP-like cAMP-binding protein